MMKLLFIGILTLAFAGAALSQDIIVTKDSKRINAKVTEVDIDNVKYKKFNIEDSPVYTISKSDVVSILYQNGDVDIFETGKKSPPRIEYIEIPNEDDLIGNMKNKNPRLYGRYRSGQKMRQAGGTLIAGGIGGIVIGGAFIIGSNINDEDYIRYGYWGIGLALVGGSCLAAGIPINAIGKGKMSGAIDDFVKQNYSSSQSSYFKINLRPNGIGIAYVFGNK